MEHLLGTKRIKSDNLACKRPVFMCERTFYCELLVEVAVIVQEQAEGLIVHTIRIPPKTFVQYVQVTLGKGHTEGI